jgi:hypothetical protein
MEPTLFGAASWSADGSSFAFSAFPRGHGEKAKSKIYLASADGTDIRPAPGTVGGTQALLSPGTSNLLMEINADGTCATTVLGKPRPRNSLGGAALYAPTWQPGPGREAGPIAC